jgi:predicted nucleic acid-binding protein
LIAYSNTTPFISLSSIGCLDLFPKLFGKVYVAESVIQECSSGGIIFVPNLKKLDWIIPVEDDNTKNYPMILDLDNGEKQTILLALKNKADKVIIDERIGRSVAEYLGLSVTGTLGVLAKAKSLGYIESFHKSALEMKNKGIFYNINLIEKIAKDLAEI